MGGDSVRGELEQLSRSFARHLKATGKSERTIQTYLEAVTQFHGFLPDDVVQAEDVTVDHIEDFITELLDTRSAGTASNRYRALQQFFKFLVHWEAIAVSPMAKTKPPPAGEPEVPSLTDDEITALLATCTGKAFEDRRDNAIIRLFVDTGMRKSELVALTVEDLDLDGLVATVAAKRRGRGPRRRDCPFGGKTAAALDRYVYERSRHRFGATEWLWVQRKGQLNGSGVATMLRRRGIKAGIGPVHPHQFRHSWAEAWLDDGGSEIDLRRLAGWEGMDMVERYTKSSGERRARKAHRRISFGDRF